MAETAVDLQQRRASRSATRGLDATAFRPVAGLFTSGVTVVTAASEDTARGATASTFAPVSMDPLRVLVCVRGGSGLLRLVAGTGRLAVCVLRGQQDDVACWFANTARPDGFDRLDRFDWRPGQVTGAPLLAGCRAWVECDVVDRLDTGDHEVLVGRVLALGRGDPCDPPARRERVPAVVPAPRLHLAAAG